MNHFTQILRTHNLKATPQRIEIADALYHHGHLTIESLYMMLLKKFDSISLATIYKNINLMIDSAFIQEVKIPHAKSVYELTKATHSHAVCSQCGAVEDITIDLADIEEKAHRLSSFEIRSSELVFGGICKNCQ
jgi:Fur family peroxide stress response transcriptional regulator